MLATLKHLNWDPVIFRINDALALRWYGLMYVMAFTLGYFIFRWLQTSGYFRIKLEDISSYIVHGVLGVFLGGRLGYILFYQFDRIFLALDSAGNPTGEAFSDRMFSIVKVWEGGMSFHGGVFGVAVAIFWFAWRKKYNFWNMMDATSHVVPLGVALVRIGNFINGELYGRVITDDAGRVLTDADKLPWYAMRFPTDRSVPQEYFQSLPVDDSVWTSVEQFFPYRYPSQLVQFAFEGMLVLFLIWIIRRWFNRPGQIASMFLILYAIFRIPAEMIRQPDSQIDPTKAGELTGTAAFLQSMGLTMGQFLSVVIFVWGLVMVLLFQWKSFTGQR
ncbi:prolipoprotein diacylglyceryl transferase, partial [Planctomycetota bacterium]|nr:prolipoprotein diacylglyceryl transferase [Planctomycetota bacterium]